MIEPNIQDQEFIQAIFNTVIDPLVIVNDQGVVLAANAATEAVFGWSKYELVGASVQVLMPEALARRHHSFIQQYLNSGTGSVIGQGREVEAVTKDGRLIPIHLSVGHCEIRGRHFFTGVIRDLTEQKRTQSLMAQREKILEGVLNAPDEVIVVFDQSGSIVLSNDAAAKSLGFAVSDVVGKSLGQLMQADLASTRNDLIQQAFRTGKAQRFMDTRDGCYYENLISPVFNDEEEVELVTVFARDITSLKASEAKLVKETKRAEMANRAKTEFLSNMSHELRTPLNSVVGFAHLLNEDKSLNEDQQDSVSYIAQAGEHLKNLIEDILDLARIEAGRLSITSSVFDFSVLLLEVLDMFGQRLDSNNLHCKTLLAQETAWVCADRTRLKQVLLNFMDNAIKYNRPNGSIEIITRVDDQGMLEVSFIDTGVGISEENLKSLFQPFNRLGYESSGIPGTGIGLVLSKRLVESMKGVVRVSSEEGKGSCFSLTLPFAEDNEPHRPQPSAEMDTGTTSMTADTSLKLLYIEDSESNIALMERFIHDHLEWQFHVSRSGLDAPKLAQNLQPDVILLDINLEDVNGLEVAIMLNHSPLTQHIPIIAVTADASEETRQACEYAGIHLVHTKPVDFILLEKVLKALSS